MRQALELHEFRPVSSAAGDSFDLDYKEYIRLTYYRNNIIPLRGRPRSRVSVPIG